MRAFKSKAILVAFVLLTGISQGPVVAQNTSEWKMMKPEGEEFTIEMPADSVLTSGKEPYHKMELNTRFYISAAKPAPVFLVASLSGIKSNPALYPEMTRLNSYVDALKTFLPARVRTKDAVVKFTFVKETQLNGHNGREYDVTVADLSGNARVFATRRRFYAVVFLNTKKHEPFRNRFVSSFYLPEKVEAPAATTAGNQKKAADVPNQDEGIEGNPADAQATVPNSGKPDEGSAQTPNTAQGTGTAQGGVIADPGGTQGAKNDQGAAAPPPTANKRPPIAGGVLNGRALMLPRPEVPSNLRGLSGTVVIQVVIDEQGNVMSVTPVSGPAELYPAASNAAVLAKFAPTYLMGEAVKVTGVLVFGFTPVFN